MKAFRIRFNRLPIFCAFAIFLQGASVQALDVILLTKKEGALTPSVLKSWTPAELATLAKGSSISAQKLIIDESTDKLDPNARAEIDLITLYGDQEVARVPRFMIWRGLLKLEWDKKTSTLSSHATGKSRLLVPAEIFKVRQIRKIELVDHAIMYPGTTLRIRTNPAASRGEKLFTQSCLACHGLAKISSIRPEQITAEQLKSFTTQHRAYQGMELDARGVRGLVAYSEALASEKNEVKSIK